MTKQSYRKEGDRIITEEQYQSEKASRENTDLAIRFKIITVPAGLAAAVGSIIYLPVDGWFWKALIAVVAGFAAFLFVMPAIMMIILIFVGWLIWRMGGFG